MNIEEVLKPYDYALPESAIAFEPITPRDAAKLLVYNRATQEVQFDTFRNLANYLPKGALLIFNDTKVIPARLPTHLPTGGKVELLCLSYAGTTVTALSPRILPIGTTLATDKATLTVVKKEDTVYTLTYSGRESFEKLLARCGCTPIPPYLKNTRLSEKELRTKYQTVFAKNAGSVAAPTASLHFTERLLTSLKKKGFKTAHVTLHVGLGTFAPLTEEHIKTGHLHSEYFALPPKTIAAIEKAKKEGRPIIPVGTTALRTIESAYAGKAVKPSGTTTLFIQPGYTFKIATGLVTNFHVPKSSLLMLVSALIGREKLLSLYELALRHGFRFFSFGDGMLIK